MTTITAPTTVRLTPKAAAALTQLESKHPGISRSTIVQNALSEALLAHEAVPISEQEFAHASFVYKYLIGVASAHGIGPKKTMEGAGEVALAAKSAALLLKRVFLEAKGRVVMSKT